MNSYIYDYSNYENKFNFNYSHYKKTLNKNNNFSLTIIVFFIILLLGLCVFFKPQTKDLNKFYYAQIGDFQTYNEALNLSTQLQNDGVTSYVYFDKSYHVLLSFYSTSSDAEKVTENLKNDFENSDVFSISFARFFKRTYLSNNQNSAIEDYLKTTYQTILSLEHLANQLDRSSISFNEAKILLQALLEDYDSMFDTIISNFRTNSSFNVSKKYANEILVTLTNLIKKEEQEFSALLRYHIIDISINYANFSDNI